MIFTCITKLDGEWIELKKVLGLVVSERRLGNSELLVKEIMANVPEPCERELIRLTELNIRPCRGCYRCLQPGAACSIRDDFNFLLGKIKECAALVIGLPVYFLGPHAGYKALTDRMLGAGHYVADTAGKPCVLVASYGVAGWEGYTRAAALVLPRVLQMNLLDYWAVHAALPGESLLAPQNLEKARSLGENLFSGRSMAAVPYTCPGCGSDLFRVLPGNKVECPLCTAVGRLQPAGAPDFAGSGPGRFSPEKMKEHFGGWLVSMKNKFLREKDLLKEVQAPYKNKDWWIRPGNGASAGEK